MNNILVALSLNEDYGAILAYSCWLSRLLKDSNINLISVADYYLTPPAYILPYFEKELESSRRKLSIISEDLRNRGIISRYTLITGRLIESFHSAICELKASFMVLGYKDHLIRSSSSERMIKTLNIPMLVVRGDKSKSATIDNLNVKNILCVTDFSENSLRAIQLIERLYGDKPDDINVTVANVISTIKVDKLLKEIPPKDSKDRYYEEIMAERVSKLDSIKIAGLDIKRVCNIGVPYNVINDICSEINADILFMGAKGITSIEGIRVGSVAESVLKTSSCPVMLVN